MPIVRRSPTQAEPIRGLPIPQIDDLFPVSRDVASLERQAALKARYFNRLAGISNRWEYPLALVEFLGDLFEYWALSYLGRVTDSGGLRRYDAILRTYSDLLIQRGEEENARFAQIHRKNASTILTGAAEELGRAYGFSDFPSGFVTEQLQAHLQKRHRYWLAAAAAQAMPPAPKSSMPVRDATTANLVEDFANASPVAQDDPARKSIMEALDAGKREEAVRLWQKQTGKTKTDLYKAARVHRSDYYKWQRGLLPETSVKHLNLRRELLSD